MKNLPYKNDLRIKKKYIVHGTSNQNNTEKFKPTTSDREIVNFKFRSSIQTVRNSASQTAFYFIDTFVVINVKNGK